MKAIKSLLVKISTNWSDTLFLINKNELEKIEKLTFVSRIYIFYSVV